MQFSIDDVLARPPDGISDKYVDSMLLIAGNEIESAGLVTSLTRSSRSGRST
jgi:hypothetical protein